MDVIKEYYRLLTSINGIPPILISRLDKLPIVNAKETELFLKKVNNVVVAKSEFIGGESEAAETVNTTDYKITVFV